MELLVDNIRRLIEELKGMTFFDRLFRWSRVKNQLIDSNGDLQRLIARMNELNSTTLKLDSQLNIAHADTKNLELTNNRLSIEHQALTKQTESFQSQIATLTEQNKNYFKRANELSNEILLVRQKLEASDNELQKANSLVADAKKNEEFRRHEHSNAMASLKQIQEVVQKAREEEINERNKAEITRLSNLKETWVNHEEHVRNRIKVICSKNAIDYVDKVPFKGKPDNTIRINDEFIIFDAKSPANEDISNFPTYIKNQAEGAIKYVREEGVRREVFL